MGLDLLLKLRNFCSFRKFAPKNFANLIAKFPDLNKGHNTIKDAQAGFQTLFVISLVEIIILKTRSKFKSKVPEGMISIDVSG